MPSLQRSNKGSIEFKERSLIAGIDWPLAGLEKKTKQKKRANRREMKREYKPQGCSQGREENGIYSELLICSFFSFEADAGVLYCCCVVVGADAVISKS